MPGTVPAMLLLQIGILRPGDVAIQARKGGTKSFERHVLRFHLPGASSSLSLRLLFLDVSCTGEGGSQITDSRCWASQAHIKVVKPLDLTDAAQDFGYVVHEGSVHTIAEAGVPIRAGEQNASHPT